MSDLDININGTINASYGIDPSINVSFESEVPLDVDFGSVYIVGGECKVLYASSATWNSTPRMISKAGYIYIYSDARQNEHGTYIPAMKVGDGRAYLIDLPFSDELYFDHINNAEVHVTQEEREFWNGKVRCYIDPEDNKHLIFTTD